MSGSYQHISRFENGERRFRGVELIDNLGDAYEALEQCWDMIEYLSGGEPIRIAEAWMHGHLVKHRSDLYTTDGKYSARMGEMEQAYVRDLTTEEK